MNPLTESRQAIVTALAPLKVTIYGAPPESVTPPAAVVIPGQDPWYSQHTYGSIRVAWQVTLMATMQGANAAALERLEDLIWNATAILETVGVVTGPSSPRILKMGPAEVAAADLLVHVHVTTGENP